MDAERKNIMLQIRNGDDRGGAVLDWLNSKHTFSFGHYYDPNQMGYGPLRVINEDRVQPGTGFDPHGHQDMEIISYVLDGALKHEDSTGNEYIVAPGDVQRMTAGTGIRHSEMNASDLDPVHFLQIWIIPEKQGLAPGYEQINFPAESKRGQLRLIGSRDGRAGSLTIHQNVDLYSTILVEGESVTHALAQGRGAWVQVARGAVVINGTALNKGDGAAIEETTHIEITASDDAEVLLFDLVP